MVTALMACGGWPDPKAPTAGVEITQHLTLAAQDHGTAELRTLGNTRQYIVGIHVLVCRGASAHAASFCQIFISLIQAGLLGDGKSYR